MLRKFVAAFRRINRPPPPEHSVALRAAAAAATLVGVVALWTAEIIRPTTAALGLLAIPAGMAFSYVFRRRDNWEVKLALSLAILVAFGTFLRSVARVGVGSIADTIQPLGELMVWVQVMHSFDVPGRRDLYFSLAAAVSMVAAGAVQAITDAFGAVFLAFGVAALLTLALGHKSEMQDVVEVRGGTSFGVAASRAERLSASQGQHSPELGGILRRVLALVALSSVVMVSTLATFAVLPRFRTGRIVKLPFSIKGINPTGSDGLRVETPGLVEADAAGGQTVVQGGYFGFANQMDLSVRGRPDDELVMRVRADRPAFWRGLAYATYDGRFWYADEDPPDKIEGTDNEMVLPSPPGPALAPSRYDELIQTFFIEAPQANLVFSAYRPTRLYYPAAYVRLDRNGSLRSPVQVDQGMVYSVVSRRLDPGADELRAAETGTQLPQAELERYLQVPDTLPQRVRDLAASITRDAPTRYDKVLAIESWLMQNTEYTLDIPPLPPGADAVDHFLFEERRGFCEQIATAEVILLRLSGVPARLVSGYVPGERSFFSGTFEVRGSDAHAWTEIYYPGLGWVESDPTYVVPKAGTFSNVRYALDWLRRRYDALPAWIRAPFDMVGRYARGVGRLEPANLVSSFVALAATTGGILAIRRHRRRRAEAALAWEQRVLARMEAASRKAGIQQRYPHETFREFSYRFGSALVGCPDVRAGPQVAEIAALLDRQVFSARPLDEGERRQVDELLARLEAELDEAERAGLLRV